MKSKVMNIEVRKIGYPVLKRFQYIKGGEKIVLFSAPGTGTLVYNSHNSEPIGHFSAGWIESEFTEISGQVILEN